MNEFTLIDENTSIIDAYHMQEAVAFHADEESTVIIIEVEQADAGSDQAFTANIKVLTDGLIVSNETIDCDAVQTLAEAFDASGIELS